MKKILFTLFLAVFATASALAQVPKYFNYHGVVAEKNSQMAVLVKIIDISNDPNLSQSEHPVVYGESHMVKTNPNGAFTLKIGSGSRTGSASFEDVDFSKGAYGVKITAGTHTSVFPLVSVPYALVAQSMPGFAEAQQDIEDLKSLLSDYKTLLSKVESLEKDNESLKKSVSKIETIEGNITALNSRVGTAEGNISSLDSRVTALEAGGGDNPGGGSSTGIENVHEYVDLGLPSGLKWATCNVGASKPEDYGDYFAWGAITPLYESGYAQEDPQKHWKAGMSDGYCYNNTPYQTANTTSYSSTKWTKYVGSTTSSFKDPSATDADALKTTLDLSDDAAHVNWGGSWRMPTWAELDELREKCTCTWTTQGGMNGYKVTSNTNGNSLFLPAAGYRSEGSLYDAGSYGLYWSSSLRESYSNSAYVLYFMSGYVGTLSYYRCYGQSVRAVCP